jgi:hypothetical protein
MVGGPPQTRGMREARDDSPRSGLAVLLAVTGPRSILELLVPPNPFRLLSIDRLTEDVAFLSRELPGTMMAFHDPNFGVKLDEVLSAVETVPPDLTRTPFVWSVVNIPHPFGGTPLFDQYFSEGRILEAMPFSFSLMSRTDRTPRLDGSGGARGAAWARADVAPAACDAGGG